MGTAERDGLLSKIRYLENKVSELEEDNAVLVQKQRMMRDKIVMRAQKDIEVYAERDGTRWQQHFETWYEEVSVHWQHGSSHACLHSMLFYLDDS